MNEKHIIYEYSSLREEILLQMKNRLYLFISSIPLTATILGFAITKKDPYLCLSPLLILIPSLYLYIAYTEGIFMMGTYIRLFIESKSKKDMKWEYYLYKLTIKDGKNLDLTKYATLSIFHSLSIICILLSCVFTIDLTDLSVSLILFLLYIVHLIFSTELLKKSCDYTRHEEKWLSAIKNK